VPHATSDSKIPSFKFAPLQPQYSCASRLSFIARRPRAFKASRVRPDVTSHQNGDQDETADSDQVSSKRDLPIIPSDRLYQPKTKFVPAPGLDDAATHARSRSPICNWIGGVEGRATQSSRQEPGDKTCRALAAGVFASLSATGSTIVSTLKT
jgi:hypothetical protein